MQREDCDDHDDDVAGAGDAAGSTQVGAPGAGATDGCAAGFIVGSGAGVGAGAPGTDAADGGPVGAACAQPRVPLVRVRLLLVLVVVLLVLVLLAMMMMMMMMMMMIGLGCYGDLIKICN